MPTKAGIQDLSGFRVAPAFAGVARNDDAVSGYRPVFMDNSTKGKGYVLHLTFTCNTRNKFAGIVHICQVSPLTIPQNTSLTVRSGSKKIPEPREGRLC